MFRAESEGQALTVAHHPDDERRARCYRGARVRVGVGGRWAPCIVNLCLSVLRTCAFAEGFAVRDERTNACKCVVCARARTHTHVRTEGALLARERAPTGVAGLRRVRLTYNEDVRG